MFECLYHNENVINKIVFEAHRDKTTTNSDVILFTILVENIECINYNKNIKIFFLTVNGIIHLTFFCILFLTRRITAGINIHLISNIKYDFIFYILFQIYIYQTSHFFIGFIRDPGLHLNSSENSLRFETGPITRNLGGEWESFSISRVVASFVMAEHQTYM